MKLDDDLPAAVPDWMVTYGDIMSLLLTFFIMLVSMSEIKQNDKFQGVADSLHRQFGYDTSLRNLLPGELRPRNAGLAALALAGHAQRRSQLAGTTRANSPGEDNPPVPMIRPANRTIASTVVLFDETSTALSPAAQSELRQRAERLSEKAQSIEVRGHVTPRPATATESTLDNWDLAYQRARATMQFLTSDLNIAPERIRMSVAGPTKLLPPSIDAERMLENPRVEVLLLDEVASDQAASKPSLVIPPTP